MQSTLPRPPYNDELAKTLNSLKFPATITPDLIPAIRARPTPGGNEIIFGQPISHEERSIKVPNGNITISIFRSTNSQSQTRPAILWYHGGGFFSGSRFGGVPNLVPFVKELDAVIIAVEYRLVEDCYAALVWVGENRSKLGINPAKLMVAGVQPAVD
jgi:acetyl esterase/lipase